MAKKRTNKKPTANVEAPRSAAPDETGEQPALFPIVGIGASAGGLEAFETFFRHLPSDSSMAFVIVQHLDPTHKSILTELLKKYTSMPVLQVQDGIAMEPNAVYVIPPGYEMLLQDGRLRLLQPPKPRGLRLPIDSFFRSLADSQKERAICIILSGTGTDGTLGLKSIKEAGGLTIVQSPESAQYDGMPFSAVNTGLADIVLPVDKIAEQLSNYIHHYFGSADHSVKKTKPEILEQLQRIFTLLREDTGHDFSGYKENTILRRIERRMAVNQLAGMKEYLEFLESSPLEGKTLFRELLIGVTSFFRDPEAFEQLGRKVIVPLFAQIGSSHQIRVWIPGCSTGEEAFSVAILLQEQMELSGRNLDIQIFATDIDHLAIEKAREANYPESIATDISPERLQKYFVKEEGSPVYRVRREIREMVIFAVQNLVKDPPFSRLDLICCRNLMIYLGSDLQQRLFSIFHYALKQNAYLFLGNSENLGISHDYFRTLDTKWKIFQKSNTAIDVKTVLEFPYTYTAVHGAFQHEAHADRHTNMKDLVEGLLLSEYTPTCVVINESGEVLYIHGRTGKYLEQTTGEVSTNILHMARDGLRMSLNTAIRRVISEKSPYTSEEVSVEETGGTIHVKVTVSPILRPADMQGLLLVVFNEVTPPETNSVKKKSAFSEQQAQRISELENELKSTREYLQTTVEELETTNEELKSAVEELQSSNEELQSTNEELQTSKEELQSVNQELITVNAELQTNIEELTLANNDIKNLLDNIQVGVIFLDMDLRIRRFTPSASGIVDLIPADVGRLLAQFVHKLEYNRLIQDVRETLDTLVPKELEVQNRDGNWYLMNILPYYTFDQEVDGAVLTITDVTELKHAERALADNLTLYQTLVEASHDGIIHNDVDGHILSVNSRFVELFGFDSVNEILESGITTFDLLAPEEKDTVQSRAAPVFEADQIRNVEMKVRKKDGSRFDAEFNTTLIRNDQGVPVKLVTYVRDITGRKQAEAVLRESEEKYSALFIKSSVPAALFQLPDGVFVDANNALERLFGYSREEMIGRTSVELGMGNPKQREQIISKLETEGSLNANETRIFTKAGEERFVVHNSSLLDVGGQPHIIVTLLDVTERKQMEDALRESEEKAHAFLNAIPDLMFRLDRNGVFLDYKAEQSELYADSTDIIGKRNRDLSPPEFADLIDEQIRITLKTGQMQIFEYQLPLPNRSVHDYEARMFPSGEDEVTAIVRNVTVQKQAEAAYRASQKLLHEIVNNTPALIYIFDIHDRIVLLNNEIEKLLGVQSGEIVGKTRQEVLPEELAMQHRNNDLEVIQSRSPKTFIEESPEIDKTRYYLTTKFPLFDAENEVYAICGISVDITERKQSEEQLLRTTEQLSLRLKEIEQLQEQLQEQAIRDPLTGLHNRRYMSETLEREITRAGRDDKPLSVIVSDLDRFKAINDTHGHKLGDDFLVQISTMLKKHTRGSDIVCRYGGEEFLLVLPNTKLDSAVNRAEEIRQRCMDLIIHHAGRDLNVTMSFGVAVFPEHGQEADELVIKADKAMYRAKQKGGNRVDVWDIEIQ